MLGRIIFTTVWIGSLHPRPIRALFNGVTFVKCYQAATITGVHDLTTIGTTGKLLGGWTFGGNVTRIIEIGLFAIIAFSVICVLLLAQAD